MRLKSDIWVAGYLRICAANGLPGVLVRRGDADAGAIFVRVSRLDGQSDIYGPAAAGLAEASSDRQFSPRFPKGPVPDTEADAYLARQKQYDPDLWIVEIEARDGRHCLGDWLVPG